MLAAVAVLGAILVVSTIVSAISLVIVNREVPSLGEVGHLIVFYGVSWLYLAAFALIGMVPVLLTSRRSLALLWSLGIWMIVTFVVPQITSGFPPSASLNPVIDAVSDSQRFFQFTSHARPFSIGEQYKEAGNRILGTASGEPWGDTVVRILPIAGLSALLAIVMIQLVERQDYSRSGGGE